MHMRVSQYVELTVNVTHEASSEIINLATKESNLPQNSIKP